MQSQISKSKKNSWLTTTISNIILQPHLTLNMGRQDVKLSTGWWGRHEHLLLLLEVVSGDGICVVCAETCRINVNHSGIPFGIRAKQWLRLRTSISNSPHSLRVPLTDILDLPPGAITGEMGTKEDPREWSKRRGGDDPEDTTVPCEPKLLGNWMIPALTIHVAAETAPGGCLAPWTWDNGRSRSH